MRKFFKKRSTQILSVLLLLPLLVQSFVIPIFALDEILPETQVDIPIDTSEDILDEGISDPKEIAEPTLDKDIPDPKEIVKPTWVTSKESATTSSSVVLGEKYVYPNNSDVTVTFSKLPTSSSTLTISTVYLTDEQVKVTNAASNVAYDITTDMVDGTFNYDLTLPKVGDSTKVVYAESVSDLVDAKDISNVVENGSSLKIDNLNHFTVFVVIDDDGDGNVDSNFSAIGWSTNPSGYNGDHKWVTKEQTGKTATWTYTGDDISRGAIFVSWTQWDDHATNAIYRSSATSDITVNQKLNSGQTTFDGNGKWSGWYLIPGNYSIVNGTTVTLAPETGTNGNLSADAVAFVDLNEVWVDDNFTSNNTGDYMWGYNAFSKIQDAIDAVTDGGIIHVAAGTYTENLTINKSLSIKSLSGADSTIVIDNSNGSSAIFDISADNVTIDGFTLKNASSGYGAIYIHNYTSHANYILVENCIFSNNGGDIWVDKGADYTTINKNTFNGSNSDDQAWGIWLSSVDNNKITNNTISNKGYSFYGAIYLEFSDYNTISDNDLINNFTSNGIQLISSNYNIISGNTIENNNNAPDGNGVVYGNGIQLTSSSNNKILGNNISKENMGISFVNGSNNNEASGNTLTNNYKGVLIYCADNGNAHNTGNTIQENNIYGNHFKDTHTDSSTGILFQGDNCSSGTGNLNATNNWWGDASGPQASDNLSGLGNSVSSYVDYRPWYKDSARTISSDGFPSVPTNLSFKTTTGEVLGCGAFTKEYTIVATWDASIDDYSDIISYEYRSYNPTTGWVYGPVNVGNSLSRVGTFSVGEGTYGFAVRAIDLVGNKSAWTSADIASSCKITYDKTKPSVLSGLSYSDKGSDEVKMCGAKTSSHVGAIIHWDASTDVNFDHYEYISFNADGTTGPLRTFTTNSFDSSWWTVPMEGTYGFKVRAIDKAGNAGEWTETCNIVEDWTAPSIPKNGTPNGTFKTTNDFYFSWDASTDNSPVIYEFQSSGSNSVDVNGSLIGAWNSIQHGNSDQNNLTSPQIHSTGASDGLYYWQVRAIDAAGNHSNWSEIWTVTLDTQAPQPPVLVSPDDGIFTKGASVTNVWSYTSTDIAYYNYESYKDANLQNLRWNGTFTTTSKTATNVADATFWWRVQAVDFAGNKSGWSGAWKITVDNAKPMIDAHSDMTLVEGEAFPTDTLALNDDNPNQVCVKATDLTGTLGSSDYTCVDINNSNLTGNQFAFANEIKNAIENWKGTFDYIDLNVLPEGRYKIEYYATDLAGNTSDTSTFVVTIEDNIPTVTITPATSEVTQGAQAVVLSANVTSGNAPYTYLWSGDCTGDTPTTTVSTATVGTFTCNLKVTDADGDTTTSQATVTVGAVLGATDEKTPTTDKAQKANTQRTALATTSTLTEETTETTTEEEMTEEEILGETTCEATYKISGTVYYDNNDNGIKDDNEKVVKDIKVNIYNSNKELEKTVTTDEKGYWEASLCPGEYTTQVEGTEDQTFVLGDSDTTLDISVEKKTNWWLIAVIGSAVVILLVVLADRYNKRKVN